MIKAKNTDKAERSIATSFLLTIAWVICVSGVFISIDTSVPTNTFAASQQDYDLRMEFISAVLLGEVKEVKELLDRGADVNAKNERGESALILAIESRTGETQKVRMLLERGADVNAKNERGESALMIATHGGRYQRYVETVKVLLEYSPDVDAATGDGRTALSAATSDNNLKVVKILLKHSPNVNTINVFGQTPLMAATINGNKEIIELLLNASADVNFRVPNAKYAGSWLGKTALDFAQNKEIPQILRSAGAKTGKELELQVASGRAAAVEGAAERLIGKARESAGDITNPLQRAFVLTNLAAVLAEKDPERARNLVSSIRTLAALDTHHASQHFGCGLAASILVQLGDEVAKEELRRCIDLAIPYSRSDELRATMIARMIQVFAERVNSDEALKLSIGIVQSEVKSLIAMTVAVAVAERRPEEALRILEPMSGNPPLDLAAYGIRLKKIIQGGVKTNEKLLELVSEVRKRQIHPVVEYSVLAIIGTELLRSDRVKGRELILEAARIARQIPDDPNGRLSGVAKGVSRSDIKLARELFDESIRLATQISNPLKRQSSLFVIANNLVLDDRKEALQLMREAEEIVDNDPQLKIFDDPFWRATVYTNMANFYLKHGM